MPKFQRRHYEAIAEVLKDVRDSADTLQLFPPEIAALNGIITKTAEVFRRDNPRFDRDRFISACGLED